MALKAVQAYSNKVFIMASNVGNVKKRRLGIGVVLHGAYALSVNRIHTGGAGLFGNN